MSSILIRDTALDAISTHQRCQSSEFSSSEQVENGILSNSPSYYDTDDKGPKPSELYGKFMWKIESFSQVGKKERRSNIFDVGGYKWYILIYPQGCDVLDNLSLFLCVADHNKLLPGWNHLAQFSVGIVNEDPKKSKYSDSLHRFWKNEHDWGWKKFIELKRLHEGFLVDDVLIIKAQLQVVREKADRPFRCLDCQFRRELLRVFIKELDQICQRYIDDQRLKLSTFVDDKARWSSFCGFWLSTDRATKQRMSREKTGTILKVLVKHFFAEKEVTSTLVMDSIYSGLKSLEYQGMNKKCSQSNGDDVWAPYHMVYIDKDTFVLADDVVALIERIVSDTLPQKTPPTRDDRGSQNRTKERNSGEDFSNVHHYDADDRQLTELGRRTVEFSAFIQIFSQIERAHQEYIALRMQEELICEEEAALLSENGKRKCPKKKQSKKKKSGQR